MFIRKPEIPVIWTHILRMMMTNLSRVEDKDSGLMIIHRVRALVEEILVTVKIRMGNHSRTQVRAKAVEVVTEV